MKLIGLTGGTGSGKSTVAKRFAELRIPVVDADRIGHDLIGPGGAAEQSVREAFGDSILTSGIIDRMKLGTIVFNDPEQLGRLNRLVHPLLFQEIAHRCQQHEARGEAFIVIDAALLGEGGEKEPWLDELILVSAPEAVRVRRLELGRRTPPEVAWQRVRAQSDPERKRSFCRWVIDNSESMESMRRQTDAIVEELFAGRT